MLRNKDRTITRRTALGGLVAGAAVAAFAPGSALAQISCPNACRSMIGPEDDWIRGLPIIDAHCHIFNGRDIPAVNFITNVFLPEYSRLLAEKSRKRIEKEVIEFLGRSLRQTPGYAQERALLEDRLRGVPAASISPPPKLPEFALGTDKSCYGRDVAERITALQNLLRIMTGFRYEIFEALAATYESVLPGVAVSMFTPAMVDLDYWVGADRNEFGVIGDIDLSPAALTQTTIPQQIELMEMIQRLYPGRCHTFVSYCPWRQADDEARGRSPTALELVQDAILNRGFVGVKIYPPMGFLPIGNAELPIEAFPAWAADEPYAAGFGARIDDAMRALYRFCIEHDVPIMAHCAPSNGAGVATAPGGKEESYAMRAHPFGWARLLSDYEFANLRLNLAHFGVSHNPAVAAEWRAVIGQMMDDYPNVYADLSHYSELLRDSYTGVGQRCSEAAGFLDMLRTGFLAGEGGGNRARRLLYGSDWSMMSKEFYYADYLGVVAHMYRRKIYGLGEGAEGNARDFLFENTVRFLGLGRNEQARARLEAWYERHGLDPALLNRFDAVRA